VFFCNIFFVEPRRFLIGDCIKQLSNQQICNIPLGTEPKPQGKILVIGLIDRRDGLRIQQKIREISGNSLPLEFEFIHPENARQVASEFQQIVLYYDQRTILGDRRVVVFCHDGFNLTGYCIISFLRQVFKLPLSEAVRVFTDARPPGILHRPYIEDLIDLYGDVETHADLVADLPEWSAEWYLAFSVTVLTPLISFKFPS
jgi:hypothetical protein